MEKLVDRYVVGKWVFWFIWLLLFVGGVVHYPGSLLTYTMFSAAFLTMLISGFYRQISYGYLFLVVMLWLGFWLKLTVHLLVDYPFMESVGSFVGTPAAWDEVLWIATTGSVGVVVARLLYGLTKWPSSMLVPNSEFKTPTWYPATRKWMWAGLMVACIGLAITNASLGILQIGLVPGTILLWPLNAVICWLIGYGLTLGIATLLWWDVSLGRNVSVVVYFVLLEAFISTVSMLSRGGYIFHVVPQFLALYKNKNAVSGWSRKNITAVCMTFIVLFALANPLVNALRSFYYSDVPLPINNSESTGNASGASVDNAGGVNTGGALTYNVGIKLVNNAGRKANGLAKFAIDRWVGAEGVMAVSAYPKKGIDLFKDGIMERREIGKDTLYIEISRPVYLGLVDKSKFQFSEIPGVMAFLYYTGRLWVVALGMVVLVLAVLGSERLVFKFTGNPLLSALWGGAAANAVAQMGVAPRGLFVYFFELSCGIAAICFVQSECFSRALQKFSLLRSAKSGA